MRVKPIRVFYSPLSGRFFAANRYREQGNGVVIFTGEKYDVTQDIARAVIDHDVEFRIAEKEVKQ